jgi:hypothetical protein
MNWIEKKIQITYLDDLIIQIDYQYLNISKKN